MPARPHTVVFDLGGVLLDWNPRYLYREFFQDDAAAMERFLTETCTAAWNDQLDAGIPFADAIEELAKSHPAEAPLIRLWWDRWPEMLGPAFADTVELMADLKAAGTPLFALSNWSAETFPITRARFPFLDDFDGLLISGEVRMKKPDLAIFHELLRRFSLRADEIVFIDDNPANVAAAESLGIRSIQFERAAQARAELVRLGFDVADDLRRGDLAS
jgi:2-haloacid dehalogenase